MHVMEPTSPWASAIADMFNDQDLPNIYHKTVNKYNFSIHNVGNSLWMIITWPDGGRIAARSELASVDIKEK